MKSGHGLGFAFAVTAVCVAFWVLMALAFALQAGGGR